MGDAPIDAANVTALPTLATELGGCSELRREML